MLISVAFELCMSTTNSKVFRLYAVRTKWATIRIQRRTAALGTFVLVIARWSGSPIIAGPLSPCFCFQVVAASLDRSFCLRRLDSLTEYTMRQLQ